VTPKKAYRALRQAALDYPDAYRETPWGEEVIKVRRKIFVFVGKRDGGLTATTKLPESRYAALGLDLQRISDEQVAERQARYDQTRADFD